MLIATDVIDVGETKTVVRQTPIAQPASAATPARTGKTVADIYREEGRGVVFV